MTTSRISNSDYIDMLFGAGNFQKASAPDVTEDTEEIEEPERKRERQSELPATKVSHFSKPLAAFLCEALEQNRQALEKLNEPWRSSTWTFTRLCKGHRDLENLDAGMAWRKVSSQLEKIVSRNTDAFYGNYFYADEDEVQLDFLYSWDRVRSHPGKNIIEDAVDRAQELGLKPPKDRGSLYCTFVSLCGHLQVIRREQPILVPVDNFGAILGCSKMSVSRMVRFAIEDGLLNIVETHNFAKHRARRYRFAIERYPGLLERK